MAREHVDRFLFPPMRTIASYLIFARKHIIIIVFGTIGFDRVELPHYFDNFGTKFRDKKVQTRNAFNLVFWHLDKSLWTLATGCVVAEFPPRLIVFCARLVCCDWLYLLEWNSSVWRCEGTLGGYINNYIAQAREIRLTERTSTKRSGRILYDVFIAHVTSAVLRGQVYLSCSVIDRAAHTLSCLILRYARYLAPFYRFHFASFYPISVLNRRHAVPALKMLLADTE